MPDSDFTIVLKTMRPPFLILPPICVLLGLASALHSGVEISVLHLILSMIGALTAHISVNALNEYHDFKTGLDFETSPTPFSGGSKTLPKNPEKAHLTLISGLLTLAITVLIGIYFILTHGAWIFPIGFVGILLIFFYTSRITHHPLVCLLAPGLGFGTFMVMGTYYVLTGEYSWTAFMASMVPFFLVNNLLLLNQFPDVIADQFVGRRHFPITIGRRKSAIIFMAFYAACYLTILLAVLFGIFPYSSLITLILLFLVIPVMRDSYNFADQLPELLPAMGKNVILNIVLPLLLAIGFIV